MIDVDYNKDEIKNAIQQQISHGKYVSSPLYGDGTAGKKIANILATESVAIQKTITY